ncbi:MAG: hypothetical protein LBO73_00205 [Holosporaceae bacterium]|jgi:hypothetical protein|nr:hypothetical protein [Holosporaceae bacterium]
MFNGNPYDIIKSICNACIGSAAYLGSMGIIGDVSGMEKSGTKMPVIAYYKNEGPELSKYHERLSDPSVGFKYFMPRSDEEILGLHGIWTTGKVADYDCLSSEEVLWGQVLSVINGELVTRSIDKEPAAIRAFIKDFRKFICAVDGFADKIFIKPLISPFNGLLPKLRLFIDSVAFKISRDPSLSWESCYVVYTASELDRIISSGKFFSSVGFEKCFLQSYAEAAMH